MTWTVVISFAGFCAGVLLMGIAVCFDLFPVRSSRKPDWWTDQEYLRGAPKRCAKAPEGWFCTRHAGHPGPCAAWPGSLTTAPGASELLMEPLKKGVNW